MHAQDLIIINDVHPTSRKHDPLGVSPIQKSRAMRMDKCRVKITLRSALCVLRLPTMSSRARYW
jgi:hypothetical protein